MHFSFTLKVRPMEITQLVTENIKQKMYEATSVQLCLQLCELSQTYCIHPKRVLGKGKSWRLILWKPWMSVINFKPIHQIDVEIFHTISEHFDPYGGAKWKVEGLPASVGCILWGSWLSVQHLMTIHFISKKSENVAFIPFQWYCLPYKLQPHLLTTLISTQLVLPGVPFASLNKSIL